MAEAIERQNVSKVCHHELDGRPGFKMAIRKVDSSWLLYLSSWWHSGWTVLDVTDPFEPDVLNFIEGPENTITKNIQVADGLMITSLEPPRANYGPVDGPLLDPDGPFESGAYVWDLSDDPVYPERRSHYETAPGGTHRNYYPGGDYAFMCATKEGFTEHILTILDVSNPDDPKEIAKWYWPEQDDEEPVEPTLASYFHGPAYVDGDRAFLSYGRVGMVTLDISDIHNPTLLSRTTFGNLGSGRSVHSTIPVPDTDFLAVNSEAINESHPLDDNTPSEPLNFTFLADVSDTSSPRFAGGPGARAHEGVRIISAMPMPTPGPGTEYSNFYEKPGRFGPHNQHHYRGEPTRLKTSELLFMTYFNAGLRIFDISDPLSPQEAGYYVAEDPTERFATQRPSNGLVSQFEDVVVDSRGYIYCTDPQQGLFILESDLI